MAANLLAWCVLFAVAVSFCLVSSLPTTIRIGALFDRDSDESQTKTFIHAINRVNADRNILPKSRLDARIRRIDGQDSFEASKKVCELMSEGVAAIFGPHSLDTAAHVQSICDVLAVPHIQARSDYRFLREVYSINLYPHLLVLSKAFDALVHHWKWEQFAILYENDDGLVKLTDLFKKPVKTPYGITVRQLPLGSDYRHVLKELMVLEQLHIIVDCSVDKVFRILKQAQQVGMMTSSHHYLLTSLDVDTLYLEDFSYSGTKINSLRLVDLSSPEVLKVTDELRLHEMFVSQDIPPERNLSLTTETALVFDAVTLVAKSLHDLDASQHINIKPLNCEVENSWGSGHSLINYMKAVQMSGLSGVVGFNTSYGFRSYFDLDILELRSTRMVKIGNWSSHHAGQEVKGLAISQKTPEETAKAKARLHLKVVTLMEAPPYVTLKKQNDPLSGNDRYEGYGIDLIKLIAKKCDFDYTLYHLEEGGHGKPNKGFVWSGLIGEVNGSRADLAVADITINKERETVVEFTTPFMDLGISILYREPAALPPSLLSFLLPFSSEVWLYMAVAYTGVTLLLFVLARLSPYEWDNPHPCIQEPEVLQNEFSLLNSMWFTIGSLVQQGSDIAPKAASTRLVAGIWWFFTLIMISSYTANLAACLTIEEKEQSINNIQELADKKSIKCGCVREGSTRRFFETSNEPVYQEIWRRMDEGGLVEKSNEGRDWVLREDYAFFLESTTNDYYVQGDCRLKSVGDLLDNKGYGIALPKGSNYTNMITEAILDLKEKGELDYLKKKWWEQKRGGRTCSRKSSQDIEALGLPHVGGIFVVLLGGLGLACVVAVTEFVWKTRKISTYERDSICREMIKELTLAVKCRGSKKVTKKVPVEPENGLAMPLSKYSFSEREMFS